MLFFFLILRLSRLGRRLCLGDQQVRRRALSVCARDYVTRDRGHRGAGKQKRSG
jgi:hypothetical protein